MDHRPDYPKLEMLIGDEWAGASGRDTQPVVNPATGKSFAEVPLANASDMDRAVEWAVKGFSTWRAMTAYARARVMHDITASIRAHEAMLSATLTLEQGKPLRESLLEIRNAADTFEWMAEEGKRVYGRVVPARFKDTDQYVRYEPVGPVAAFSPWNFPAALALRKVATALAAGCSVVLKPAEETPGTMVAIARLCLRAGLPPGVLNVIYGVPADVSERLIGHPAIKKISFTGSVAVGRQLAAKASAHSKKITLELGGHAPVIVTSGVDVSRVVDLAVAAKFRNAGQLCICPTRFYVDESIFEPFVKAMAEKADRIEVGPGDDQRSSMGPLANARRVQAMERFCDDAGSKGARTVAGGRAEKGNGAGYFWRPTVVANASTDVAAMHEEPFGPIALINPYANLRDAIARANSLDFGLAAYAFTDSLQAAHLLEGSLEAGNVSINSYVSTTPEMPFTGVKSSGMGVELGIEGVLEHMNIKSVVRAALPG
ncbi:NAD-dependent succinate-semialdehyde dehydrogenase [soil metagenome]